MTKALVLCLRGGQLTRVITQLNYGGKFGLEYGKAFQQKCNYTALSYLTQKKSNEEFKHVPNCRIMPYVNKDTLFGNSNVLFYQTSVKQTLTAAPNSNKNGQNNSKSNDLLNEKVSPETNDQVGPIVRKLDVNQTTSDKDVTVDNENELSIFQRFKNAYKEYGKVLIGVHVITSVVWFGGFYYAAAVGVDVVPLLQKIGISEAIIAKFTSSNVGDIALAYLMYEVAKPARYFVTLAGTRQSIVYLRKKGYMEPVAKEDRLRELVKEGREQFKEKRDELKDKIKDSQDEIRDKIKDSTGKIKVSTSDFRDKLKDSKKK